MDSHCQDAIIYGLLLAVESLSRDCACVSEAGIWHCGQVLVGAHALLANGGVMAGAGNQLTAMAAKHHAVPFVVLVGLQKLSPLFPHDPSVSFNDYKVGPVRQCLTHCRLHGLAWKVSATHTPCFGMPCSAAQLCGKGASSSR